jgi:hypothetical protein
VPELLVDFITSHDGYAQGEGWPGFLGLEMIESRTFDGGIQPVDHRPRVLEQPPLDPSA